MKLPVYSAALAGLLFVMTATAHEAAVSRYRVHELPLPASLAEGCLPGYATSGFIQKINDFGVANAGFRCYTSVDLTLGEVAQKDATFIVAPWFGAAALPSRLPDNNYSYGINNRGELFGYASEPTGVFATKWTLGGGHERLFVNPACETSLQIASAVDGNGRYVVGWAFRPVPEIATPPLDTLCYTQRWVIRTPAGVEILGPVYGAPAGINASNVAAGVSDRSAIRFNVVTRQVRVLHAADPGHNVEVTDINDLGEVAGRITLDQTPDRISCDPGVAVRWDRDGRERLLPHLPAAVSSRALAVGYDGEVVGDSGAGDYCPETDHGGERAVLWKGGRVYDLNALIPPFAGITLRYASSVNRWGQITAAGTVNNEPMTVCPTREIDPETGTLSVEEFACRNLHMFVLTPTRR